MTGEKPAHAIAIIPGDGIDPEVIDATLPVLEKAAEQSEFSLSFVFQQAGALHQAS
jgi:isocitrate/isopropylmalate dehydrogenase